MVPMGAPGPKTLLRSHFSGSSLLVIVFCALVGTLFATTGRLEANGMRRHEQWSLDQFAFEAAVAQSTPRDLVVAVLDTDFGAGHPDLDGVFLTGYDFIEDRPFDPLASDRQTADVDHGSMVASIIAAPGDGGIVGASPGVSILPIRVVPDVVQGTVADMAAGIEWALDQGADVINISIRTTRDSSAVRAALARAEDMGVPVVASSGLAPAVLPFYPGAYETTIAVTAIDDSGAPYDDAPATGYIDVAAPGVGVISAGGRPDSYRLGSGTSFAAPHVSSLLVLMLRAEPDATPAELRAAIFETARDMGDAGRDDVYGHGAIDVLAAIDAIRVEPPAPPSDVTTTRFGNRLFVSWIAASGDVDGYEVIDRDGRVIASAETPASSSLLTPMTSEADTSTIAVRSRRGEDVSAAIGQVAPANGPARVSRPDDVEVAYWICEVCFPAELDRWRHAG